METVIVSASKSCPRRPTRLEDASTRASSAPASSRRPKRRRPGSQRCRRHRQRRSTRRRRRRHRLWAACACALTSRALSDAKSAAAAASSERRLAGASDASGASKIARFADASSGSCARPPYPSAAPRAPRAPQTLPPMASCSAAPGLARSTPGRGALWPKRVATAATRASSCSCVSWSILDRAPRACRCLASHNKPPLDRYTLSSSGGGSSYWLLGALRILGQLDEPRVEALPIPPPRAPAAPAIACTFDSGSTSTRFQKAERNDGIDRAASTGAP